MANNDRRPRSFSNTQSDRQSGGDRDASRSSQPTDSGRHQPRPQLRTHWSASNPFQLPRSSEAVPTSHQSSTVDVFSPADESTRLLSREQPHRPTQPSGSRDRASIHESVLTVPGVRYRHSLRDTPNPSPGRPRARSLRPRKSVAVGLRPERNGGVDDDDVSHNFSLAGPQAADAIAANQSYVDPGYAQLNPAYEQPASARPVWGLAKPLPRVLRPGMVPTTSELYEEIVHHQKQHDDSERSAALATTAAEQERIEPTLRYDKIAPQLDNIREERELQLCEALGKISPLHSPSIKATPNRAGFFSPHRGAPIFEEEEDELPLEVQMPQLSKAIAVLQEAKLQEPPYEDAIPLGAYEALQDEVHNLHTYWSVVRLRFREPLAELLGITVQFTLGFSANLAITVSRGRAGVGDTSDWAWGLATMLAIYIAGGISGAHLNPAISIMLWIYRGFPLSKIPGYIFAQMLGAFLATLIAFSIYQPGIMALGEHDLARSDTAGNFITYARHSWVDGRTAFFTEFTATTILAIAVLALGDDTNAPPGAGMNAFIVGLVIVVLSMALGWNTGLAMNPARDFGPRVALVVLGYGTELFASHYWFTVAWLGPLAGVLLGGFLYDAAIFVGGESPVNYPPKRMKRATHKWIERWKARFRRTKKTVEDMK